MDASELAATSKNSMAIPRKGTPSIRDKTFHSGVGRRFQRWLGAALTLAFLAAGGPLLASDLDEIKEIQKKILDRLDAQDKMLKDILQRLSVQAQGPARPQIDPNKVYTIALGALPIRGLKDATVTMVEFSDYQ